MQKSSGASTSGPNKWFPLNCCLPIQLLSLAVSSSTVHQSAASLRRIALTGFIRISVLSPIRALRMFCVRKDHVLPSNKAENKYDELGHIILSLAPSRCRNHATSSAQVRPSPQFSDCSLKKCVSST
jgi:hypothetical protein